MSFKNTWVLMTKRNTGKGLILGTIAEWYIRSEAQARRELKGWAEHREVMGDEVFVNVAGKSYTARNATQELECWIERIAQ
jgi:hypothetical protein